MRDRNEDAVAVFTPAGRLGGGEALAGALPADDGAALVVLDGMGGSRCGDMACRMACESLAERLACAWPADVDARAAWLVDVVRGTSGRVNADGTLWAGQGATVALAVVVGEVVHVLHVGDVRAYVLRGELLAQRTRDDSLTNHARDQGMAEEEVQRLPPRVLMQALGIGEPVVHAQVLRLAPGDTLLLASDGLYEAVEHAELAATLRDREPAAACEALVERAIRANSGDNISALVARFVPVD